MAEKNKTGKMLMIVDPQYDFINGSLPVGGSEDAMNALAKWVNENKSNFDVIVITTDWHPTTHCSFNDNGGEWPVHCVQHSHGAAIYQPILNVLKDVDYAVMEKGLNEDREEYSIWKNHVSNIHLHAMVRANGITDINIAGLAGNICVLNSLKDGVKELPNVNFHFMKEFSPCIGEGTEVDEYIKTTERVDYNF